MNVTQISEAFVMDEGLLAMRPLFATGRKAFCAARQATDTPTVAG